VKRLALEAESRGWPLAVASTSAPESVAAMMRHVFGPELAGRFAVVLAGDIVPRKKPAPDIYLLCAERLGLPPSACFAIEDSAPGLAAARSAGMPCLVTVSEMTAGQDFSGALAVVDSLGEPHDPCCVTIDSLLQWSTAYD
jgi:beta-phosphoglucomutase-like phosphatase (HAD superfamily)